MVVTDLKFPKRDKRLHTNLNKNLFQVCDFEKWTELSSSISVLQTLSFSPVSVQ